MVSRLDGSGTGLARETWLRIARLGLWLIGLAAGAWLIASALIDPRLAGQRLLFATFALVGLSFLACGLVAWRHRPERRLGPLMVLLGGVWLAGLVGQMSDGALPSTLGAWINDSWVVLLTFFLVTFPHARFTSTTDRLLVAPFAFTAFVLGLVWLLFLPDLPPQGNALVVWPDAEVADAVDTAQRVIYVVASFVVVAVLAVRWARASPPQRRGLTPILAGGAALLVANVQLVVSKLGGELFHSGLLTALMFVLTAVPVLVLVDMLRARLARSAVADLVLALHASLPPQDLGPAVARALGDPSLRVVYWLPEHSSYADLDGHPVELPADRARWTAVVDGSGTPVAALLHDPSLHEQPALLDAVGAAAGLALERARLHAELHVRLDELRSTHARILDAAQSERRRLERDLHDGAQQRLVTLALDLGRLERRLGDDPDARRGLEEARGELGRSLEELRELARGIHPAVVTGRGLETALQGLVARAPVPVTLSVALPARPPEPVEVAAYYMVSECLTNVAKYADASAVSVDVLRSDGELVVEVADDGVGGATGENGSGLHGLTDRVESLGGHLHVTSLTGHGTRVRAEIPCA